ncbi:GroES-like protein [Piedraia hortae CBS 480.64]|uniref:GroES-like protein n=1 Tax=Piedraia hortae CBS 480.64 TaxID=1314780 RepID=A0A6A7C5J5_9PEZI|nr:GroES-like protein [Piedraia hortae CBS 480.64]
MSTSIASVLHGPKDLRLEPRSLPTPAPDELQIRITATGLCGSDLHYYHTFRNGSIYVLEPLSLGHESAGIVVAVGSSISPSTFSVNDKVAIECAIPCSTCSFCTSHPSRQNLCPNLRFRSSGKLYPHFQGTLQQRINHPARWCYKLPEQMGCEMGALLEPLGVAVHAWRRAQAERGERVLVLGAGAVGLLCAGVGMLRGMDVTIADLDVGRVGFAVENRFAGRKVVLSPPEKDAGVERMEGIAREVGEFDLVMECTGVPACVQLGIYAARPGGRVMLIGMGHPVQTLPIGAAALREVDLLGVFRYTDTYPESMEIVSKALDDPKAPDIGKLVTHRFRGLESVPDAFERAGKSRDEEGNVVVKVMVVDE